MMLSQIHVYGYSSSFDMIHYSLYCNLSIYIKCTKCMLAYVMVSKDFGITCVSDTIGTFNCKWNGKRLLQLIRLNPPFFSNLHFSIISVFAGIIFIFDTTRIYDATTNFNPATLGLVSTPTSVKWLRRKAKPWFFTMPGTVKAIHCRLGFQLTCDDNHSVTITHIVLLPLVESKDWLPSFNTHLILFYYLELWYN